ncbi:hypothetical protein ESCO_000717 [Escovopsis weberi]|uniref:Uncharacterized protein n=1 Tax=Escovopsis weberi TaxID=150374 RepID=A0A0M9VTB2_ESCWE|nr:hypothetical protein ESCO_000717 [Escovopsis weberi]
MPVQLLPASAAAFAPRASSVNVVLGNKIEPWLTQTLKRINRVKRPLNNVQQHQRCLTETLSSPNAIWILASMMLAKLPFADMPEDSTENLFAHQLVHIEAYIVHVDMVLRNEVAYKLTTDTIDALVEWHKEIFCVDAKASTYNWSEKEDQCKKLHEDFVQAINKFVFRTHVSALEGLEEEGAGELLNGKSDEVKTAIMNLMKPLLPPPPRVVDVIRQPPVVLCSSTGNMWSQPTPASIIPAPVDPWHAFPSSPSGASSCDPNTPLWTNMGMNEVQLPSPTPSFSQSHSTADFFFNSPQLLDPVSSSLPLSLSLPLPSMLAPAQCGMGIGMGTFEWDRYPEYAIM